MTLHSTTPTPQGELLTPPPSKAAAADVPNANEGAASLRGECLPGGALTRRSFFTTSSATVVAATSLLVAANAQAEATRESVNSSQPTATTASSRPRWNELSIGAGIANAFGTYVSLYMGCELRRLVEVGVVGTAFCSLIAGAIGGKAAAVTGVFVGAGLFVFNAFSVKDEAPSPAPKPEDDGAACIPDGRTPRTPARQLGTITLAKLQRDPDTAQHMADLRGRLDGSADASPQP